MTRCLTFVALALMACGQVQPAVSQSSASEPSPVVSPTALTTASPQPSPTADVCHVNGVTYCVLNPAVTQDTISTTICRPGWTKTIRPPVTYTDQLKRQQLAQLADQHTGDPSWTVAGTEEDHRLPLALGGAPRDPMNLSPQGRAGADRKNADEAVVRQHVCSSRLLLVAAQQAFVTKWLAPWPEYRE